MRAFIIAMPNEAEAVAPILQDGDKLYLSGVGKVNAAATTQRAIDEAKGREMEIWNIGLCGGFEMGMKVGDVYEVDRAVEYDFDLANMNNTEVGQLNERNSPYIPLRTIGVLPVKALATGDHFNDSNNDIALFRHLGTSLRDMEGAAVAHVCEKNNIVCHAIKCISNVQGESSMIGQFKNNTEKALKILEQTLKRILTIIPLIMGITLFGADDTISLSGWKNEVVNFQIDTTKVESVKIEGMHEADISLYRIMDVVGDKGSRIADRLAPYSEADEQSRSVWVKLEIPKSISAGVHPGEISYKTKEGTMEKRSIRLEVINRVLPDSKSWKFFLDLWQHPWAIARYHKVEPFSKEHYEKMRPYYELLANAGQKVITTTIIDLPWNNQSYDAYHSMINGFDFSRWDEYVTFCESCGLWPQIHCYTMVPWKGKLRAGTKEYDDFWAPILTAFENHLRATGRLGRVYIALDERNREELKAAATLIRKVAPGLRLAMAGNRAPEEFNGIAIDNYCQAIEYVKKGCKANSFYVCCVPDRPNTFVGSSWSECEWLPLFAFANGLNGMLRWAFLNWPEDPVRDARFGSWKAGDTFLVYPGPQSSCRFEKLRDGIEEYEKLRILESEGKITRKLNTALEKIDFKHARQQTDQALAAEVKEVIMEIRMASKK